MATTWQKIQLFYQGTIVMLSLCPSPVPVTCILMCYLLLIGVGPKLMAQTASQPQPVLIIYNFAMVCLSACMFYEFTASSWLANYSLLCQPVVYSTSSLAMQMAMVCWWFYSSEVIELSDTVSTLWGFYYPRFHLTFLHVYHHGTMIFNWWAGVKYVAGVRPILSTTAGAVFNLPGLHFLIVTIHTISMNAVVFAYSLSLTALFRNFYQS
uniref:Elongation of very long chain fatty acids protein n=1 Tax=Hucho hucho TaxID=62062 RepID=A0A4W5JKP7_9TELE